MHSCGLDRLLPLTVTIKYANILVCILSHLFESMCVCVCADAQIHTYIHVQVHAETKAMTITVVALAWH